VEDSADWNLSGMDVMMSDGPIESAVKDSRRRLSKTAGSLRSDCGTKNYQKPLIRL